MDRDRLQPSTATLSPGPDQPGNLRTQHHHSGRPGRLTDVHETGSTPVAFNYLIGASDAHAKNYSILLAGNPVRLAPLYDLASALPYDPNDDDSDLHKTAMAIGGQRRFGAVTAHHWDRLAHRTGTDPDRLVQRVHDLAGDLPDALADAFDTVPASPQRDQLRSRLLDRISAHLRHVDNPTTATATSAASTSPPAEDAPAGTGQTVLVRGHLRRGRPVREFWRSLPARHP